MAGTDEQFDEEFLKRLEYLYIVSQKIASRQQQADRETEIVGSGIEFAEHRQYTPGENFQNIDWNLYARTEELFLKFFEEEKDLYIYFLLDSSQSMQVGGGEKWRYAKQVVAALSYIGLSNLDRVSIVPFFSQLGDRLPPTRGSDQIFTIFEFLQSIQPGERTEMEDAFEQFVTQHDRSGMAVVVSDFYDPEGFEEALDFLRYHKFDPVVIQLYDERELDPDLQGEVEVVDCETGDIRQVTVTPGLIESYKEAFQEYSEQIREYCNKHRSLYFQAPVQQAFDELILQVFRAGGFLG
jgi:uncharacterized protein (DUF58 family)